MRLRRTVASQRGQAHVVEHPVTEGPSAPADDDGQRVELVQPAEGRLGLGLVGQVGDAPGAADLGGQVAGVGLDDRHDVDRGPLRGEAADGGRGDAGRPRDQAAAPLEAAPRSGHAGGRAPAAPGEAAEPAAPAGPGEASPSPTGPVVTWCSTSGGRAGASMSRMAQPR